MKGMQQTSIIKTTVLQFMLHNPLFSLANCDGIKLVLRFCWSNARNAI